MAKRSRTDDLLDRLGVKSNAKGSTDSPSARERLKAMMWAAEGELDEAWTHRVALLALEAAAEIVRNYMLVSYNGRQASASDVCEAIRALAASLKETPRG